jgi:two-component system, OmpR family, copper resistance phosphate regulon response regulator CusR
VAAVDVSPYREVAVARILIAEDEARIASFLDKGLRANGFATTVVDDGPMAAAAARDSDFDLLILDLGLPGQHGLEVLAELRRRGERLPVIILTARDEVETTVAGFAGGADDYVTKPFRFEELLARIRVRLRTDAAPETTLLTVGDVTLDLRTRRASVAGRTVELTAREFSLAETFLRHPDQVLSREQLLSHVWGYDFDPESNVVDVYVRYLRRKLGGDVIETVRGAGYRLALRPVGDNGTLPGP